MLQVFFRYGFIVGCAISIGAWYYCNNGTAIGVEGNLQLGSQHVETLQEPFFVNSSEEPENEDPELEGPLPPQDSMIP